MSVAAALGTVAVLLVLADLGLAAPLTASRFPVLARTSSGAVRGPLAWALAALVRLYRAGWSGRNAGCCRFEPSCSAYALTAITRHGGVIGGLLAVRRLLRCQPLSAGGYDPVPGAAAGSTDRVQVWPGYRTASPRRGTRSEIEGSRRGTRV
ncbi:membrane protein insertion efficiency factor YidD [Parafrankia elaeagni]|uniref:membrane protein insertion efficiency factor YidD n=1 Tax=Parafrankia elaeagni TaxID=222534 RepID=UPI00039E2B79|nr:membrane protein insertion efficiency factor YidD [Parafrankia elaeagni]